MKIAGAAEDLQLPRLRRPLDRRRGRRRRHRALDRGADGGRRRHRHGARRRHRRATTTSSGFFEDRVLMSHIDAVVFCASDLTAAWAARTSSASAASRSPSSRGPATDTEAGVDLAREDARHPGRQLAAPSPPKLLDISSLLACAVLRMSKIRAVVVGASGYIGGEALRLLLGHPDVDLVAVTGNESAGKRARRDPAQPARLHRPRLPEGDPRGADAYVLSLPHGGAMDVAPKLKGKVVDLSGDFRLQDAAAFEKYYKTPAQAARRCSRSSPTASPRSTAPRSGRRATSRPAAASPAPRSSRSGRCATSPTGRAIVDGKTGSSGSGIKPGEKTHHPFRATCLLRLRDVPPPPHAGDRAGLGRRRSSSSRTRRRWCAGCSRRATSRSSGR